MLYDDYNREERALCSHLFRLLHENLVSDCHNSPLSRVLQFLPIQDKQFDYDGVKIYAEVALIRDAYFVRKPNVHPFMDKLVDRIASQEGVTEYRRYTQLPSPLNDPNKTHPKQIQYKAKKLSVDLTKAELTIYGCLQGMFNAKPDLAITIDNKLITYEAKFTEPFDTRQLNRTQKIADVWANELFEDLGFHEKPQVIISTIGAKALKPDLTWESVFEIQKDCYPPNDRSYVAFESAVKLLQSFEF